MGDWIKYDVNLPSKTEVVRMSVALGMDINAIVGLCMRFWAWAQNETSDGRIRHADVTLVDRVMGVAGFGKAMEDEGWLIVSGDYLKIPQWNKYLSKGSKERGLASARQAKKRERDRHGDVTEMSRSHRDKSVTRAEQSRAEHASHAKSRAEERREEQSSSKAGAPSFEPALSPADPIAAAGFASRGVACSLLAAVKGRDGTQLFDREACVSICGHAGVDEAKVEWAIGRLKSARAGPKPIANEAGYLRGLIERQEAPAGDLAAIRKRIMARNVGVLKLSGEPQKVTG